MALLETIATIYGALTTATEAKATVDEIKKWVAKDASLESVLTELTEEKFTEHLPRLAHFCKDGTPIFFKDKFQQRLESFDVNATKPTEIKPALLPVLTQAVGMPRATCPEQDYVHVFDMILDQAIDALWRSVATHAELARKTLLEQNVSTAGNQQMLAQAVQQVDEKLDTFIEFVRSVWPPQFDPRLDKAPPREHQLGRRTILNPFYLARAEDFNHNFEKLARLFQTSPDWNSIQSRTSNVIMEGGRGTGKSMLLRRLTAQACIAAHRLTSSKATFDDVGQDYFGVYVKLTRGYYNQFETVDLLAPSSAELLAQHELNVEIFDAFVSTLLWLEENHALPNIGSNVPALVEELRALFPKAPICRTLSELHSLVVSFEQNQINDYVRDKAFDRPSSYNGSATDTVGFLRRLSDIFKRKLFPTREMRLFLLIDEFETLLRIQQVAINTVVKMRLPDVTLKIGVRTAGCKTRDTFTPEDPIQDPRDYTPITVDYNVTRTEYLDLLKGIAAKRLEEAGFPIHSIEAYLPGIKLTREISDAELEKELLTMWESGRREGQNPNPEFRTKYSMAAVFRVLNRSGRRKEFCGFDQYALLSSGVVSNFIELCKYAFYHSLNEATDLYDRPPIPHTTQTRAAYEVSQRLFHTIDGNVPVVGELLKRLVADLGYILRQRLLNHPSDPEVITIGVKDYDQLGEPPFEVLTAVLDAAVTWSVFQLKDEGQAYRPRNTKRPPKIEFVINRIYCPALEVSARARMRVEIEADDLAKLIDPRYRADTFRKLMRKYGFTKDDGPWLPGINVGNEPSDKNNGN